MSILPTGVVGRVLLERRIGELVLKVGRTCIDVGIHEGAFNESGDISGRASRRESRAMSTY